MEHPIFISTSDFHSLLQSNSVQVIDSGMNHKEAYHTSHIPTAVFFNITEIKNKSSPLSQEIPTLEEFTDYMISLKIKNSGTIVVYDQNGFAMAGRAWFLLHHFGVDDVRILDGGFPKWVAEGRPVESLNRNDFLFVERKNDRVFVEDVKRISSEIKGGSRGFKIWDPRPAEVFQQGSVDAAVNVPFGVFFNADKTVKSKEEVRGIIRERVGEGRIITSCMKGVMASLAFVLLAYVGHEERAVYSGSFEEWRIVRSEE